MTTVAAARQADEPLRGNGLSVATVARLQAVLAAHEQVEKAVLYGSRAKGNYRFGSDIDLTLHGAGLTPDLLAHIVSEIDDLLLPYTVYLSIFHGLTSLELREHIERVGVVFYQRHY